jgi:class 3 adenylate cyclase
MWADSAGISGWLRQFANLGARQAGAVRHRGVVRDRSIGACGGAGFGLPDAADDIGRPVSVEQFQYAGPVGQAVRADDAAGAVAEQRDAVQVMKGPAAGYRFLRRVWIILGDPVPDD